MQLSAKTHNACLASLELARRFEEPQPVCLKAIASEHDISPQFLVQILLQLKRGGIVKSTRGASGGYRLAAPPSQISLLDIVTAMEGTTSELGTSSNATAQVFIDAWTNITERQQQQLAEITLDALCNRVTAHAEDMYYI